MWVWQWKEGRVCTETKTGITAQSNKVIIIIIKLDHTLTTAIAK